MAVKDMSSSPRDPAQPPLMHWPCFQDTTAVHHLTTGLHSKERIVGPPVAVRTSQCALTQSGVAQGAPWAQPLDTVRRL